jgi:uncharacterized protein (DUF1800 family)
VRTDIEQKIAHLYRRAGFGLSPEELKVAKAKGVDACLAEILHPEKIKDPLDERMVELQGEVFDLSNLEDAQAAWLYRMIHTLRPLVEKMTLFWHGHFATANSKVDNPRLMVRQNQLFRDNGLGKFRDLLLGVSRDPAMIIWLDNGLSSKKHPNENYGRELLELFTLGIGQYSEEDVLAVARAFTGWKQKNGEFFYDEKDHDDGPKTFLGQTWAWTGEEVIEAIARHPATVARISKKLVEFFAADEGCEALGKEVEAKYLETGGDIRACVTTILHSPRFYQSGSIRARVKSPAEFAVGAIRELKSSMPIRSLPSAVSKMGQALFNPPTVKGWDGGLDWINTATLFERAGFANLLASERGGKGDHWFDPDGWVPKDSDGKAVVSIFSDALLDGRLHDQGRTALEEYLNGKDKAGKSVPFVANPSTLDLKVRGLVRLLVASPEYQLC